MHAVMSQSVQLYPAVPTDGGGEDAQRVGQELEMGGEAVEQHVLQKGSHIDPI